MNRLFGPPSASWRKNSSSQNLLCPLMTASSAEGGVVPERPPTSGDPQPVRARCSAEPEWGVRPRASTVKISCLLNSMKSDSGSGWSDPVFCSLVWGARVPARLLQPLGSFPVHERLYSSLSGAKPQVYSERTRTKALSEKLWGIQLELTAAFLNLVARRGTATKNQHSSCLM